MKLSSFRIVAVAFAAILMAACAHVPTNTQHSAGVSELPNNWQVSGKLATQGMGAANFKWQQRGAGFELAISAPLGAGAAKIIYRRGELTVNLGDQQLDHYAASEWLQTQGLAVPLKALQYWIQGLPAPRLSYAGLPNTTGFEQAAWRVSLRRMATVNCVLLPSAMRIAKGDVLLKLGGMRWQWSAVGAAAVPSLFSSSTQPACTDA